MKMTIQFKSLSLIVSFLLISFSISAQIVINEFSAANYDDIQSNLGDFEDWIELYNSDPSPIDISGYWLSDRATNNQKWEFPSGTTMDPGETLLIWCSGADFSSSSSHHTNFKVTQCKGTEDIVLSDASGTIIDIQTIDLPNQMNHSWARIVDGGPDWGVATSPTPGNPNVNVLQIYSDKPDFDMDPGFYTGSVTVEMSGIDPNGTIYYTDDGEEATDNAIPYTGPITISNTTVIRARFYSSDPNIPASHEKISTYFIDEIHTIPVLSLAGGSDLQDLFDGAWSADPFGTVEYFKDGQYDNEVTGEFNKHGNDSWAYDQRGVDFIARDQLGNDYTFKDELFPWFSDRDKFDRLILKPAANDNYSFEDGAHIRDAYAHHLSQIGGLDLDCRSTISCIVYLNGQYWGVYEIREKADDTDFTNYHWGHDEPHLDYLKTWGGTWEEYGSRADWDDLIDYIDNNNLSLPANYAYVESQLNILSFIDYILINTHIVCKDWLNYNTAWWRGSDPNGDPQRSKWSYVLWDMDASFGHYINYTGIPNDSPDSDPCENNEDLSSDFEGHTEMLVKLFENDDFNDLYINRYADLNNSTFSCDFMHEVLDSMIAVIDPEMQRQINVWGGSYSDWQSKVQELKDFIDTRCFTISTGIVDCYDVEGPHDVVVMIDPPMSGNDVFVNTIIPSGYPWQGAYFSGVTMDFAAIPTADFVFDSWTILNNGITPSLTDSLIAMDFQGPDTIIAHFTPVNEEDIRLTVLVEPEGAGQVSINGTVLTTYPDVTFYGDGALIEAEAISTAPVTFMNWQANLHTLSPSDSDPIVNFTMIDSDLLIAYFDDPNYQPPVGVEEVGNVIAGMRVYPNPTHDYFTVEYALTESAEIRTEIFNVHGQMIGTVDKMNFMQSRGLQSYKIDLENYDVQPGAYYLKISGPDFSKTVPVVYLKV